MKLKYLLLVLFFVPLCLSSQEKVEAGLFLGLSSYGGDLVEPNFFFGENSNFGFGVLGRYHMSETFGLRANLLFGQMSGNDQDYPEDEFRAERDIDFESPITEVSIMAELEPLARKRYQADGTFKKILSPYVFFGFGMGFISPDTDYSRSNVNGVADDQNNDASNAQFSIPLGLGLRYDLSQKVTLGVEVGFRPTFTDYLDGISLAGNPDRNDWYQFGGIVLSARMGNSDSDGDGIADKDDNCPEIPGVVGLKGCPDSDADGVKDSEDICPYVAGLEKLSGCPDSDGDGIADKDDTCPDKAGLRATGGCPDVDGDGVIDSKDNCPNDAGLVSFNGCPDTDGDGIADKDDACPTEAGTKAKKGCPVRDTDGDGVEDDKDDCPNVKGLVTTAGCPDKDGDGVIDELDKCPNVKGTKANKGCPAIKKEDKEALDLAVKSIEFQTSSAKIKSASYGDLNKVAEILNKYPNYAVQISGHTDSQGEAAKNLVLSKNRAKSCFDYLVKKGIKANRMSHEGYGETQPIADNNTATGRQKNRRVEFSLFIK